MRITSVPGKVGYVVAAPVVLLLLQLLALSIAGFESGGLLIACGALAQVAFVVVGVRTFRGEGEPIDPPRAWWRMTARPPAGFALGALFLVQAAVSTITAEPSALRSAAVAVWAVLGLAYLGASVALARRKAADSPAAD